MPPTPTTRRRRLAAAATLLGVVGLLAAEGAVPGAATARAATARGSAAGQAERTVTVAGTGVVPVRPDVVRLDLAVEAVGETPAAALGAASEAMGKVRRALTAGGVREADLRTAGVWAQPHYETVDGRPVRRGFSAGQTLAATLRDLSTAGATMSAAVEAGGDAARINGARLEVDDVRPPRAAARAAAFADARTAAAAYATAAGRRLGPVVRIVESGGEAPPPEHLQTATKAADAVPIQPGTTEVRVTVTAVFTLA
jgi:uncharacterized protein YggE